MSNENSNLAIQLLDKTWHIRCPEDKKQDLLKCARYLDNKMREVVACGKTMGSEHIIAMAAINVIYDLLMQQNQKDLYIDSLSSRVRELQNKISKVLPQNQELEV